MEETINQRSKGGGGGGEKCIEAELWDAISNRQKEKAASLLSLPDLDINWGDPEQGRTSLFRACGYAGDPDMVKMLLAHPSIDPNKPQAQGGTPLFIACQAGHVQVVEVLLEDPRIEADRPRDDGITPFFMACQEGHAGVVRQLLNSPIVDPNRCPSENGVSPLFVVCQEGGKEIVELLIRCDRVDPTLSRENGASPFMIACEKGRDEIVQLLLRDPRIDPNRRKNTNATPLWFAAQNGHLGVAERLLASSWDIDTHAVSTFGNTDPLQWAIERKNFKIADLIKRYRDDPSAVRLELRRKLIRDGSFS